MKLLDQISTMAQRQGHQIALQGATEQLRYRQLQHRIEQLCQQLIDSGCQRLAIALDNEPDWLVLQLAAFKAGVCVIPVPPFFSKEQCLHLLEQAGVDLLVGPLAELVIPLGFSPAPELHPLAYRRHCQQTPLPPGTALVTYTSGTTGQPKGVCLSTDLLDQRCLALLEQVDHHAITKHACLMPLAVLLENLAGALLTLMAGKTCLLQPMASLGIQTSGTPDAAPLGHYLQQQQPDSLILVPELLQLLLLLIRNGHYQHQLKLVAVGGSRVPHSLLALSQQFKLPLYQGYGLSECGSVVALNTPDHNRQGSVGRPLPGSHIQIADDGEILIEGPSMLGYLGDPARSSQWIASGDLGYLDPDGYLFIQGRKKNLLINSFGRNLSPEWIESELNACPLIAQSCLYGDARPFNVALVTPRPGHSLEQINRWLNEFNSQLPDYAQVRQCISTQAPFSVQNNQQTPNGRIKRDIIYGDYADELDRCYC